MKRVLVFFIYICLLTLGTSSALASEVSGTISTGDGSNSQNDSIPEMTPAPSDHGGHSSEIEGGIAAQSGSDLSGTVVSGTTQGGAIALGGPVVVGFVTDSNHPIYVPETATSTATTTEENAPYSEIALSDFGPRYDGTPGPPLAGSDLSVGSGGSEAWSWDEINNSIQNLTFDTMTSYPLLSRYGMGTNETDTPLTANALTSASGLNMTQLAIIALLSLLVLAVMGYVISKSTDTT